MWNLISRLPVLQKKKKKKRTVITLQTYFIGILSIIFCQRRNILLSGMVLKAHLRACTSKDCILLQFQLVSGHSTGTTYSIFHLLDLDSGSLPRFSLVKNRYVLFLEVEEGGNIGDNGRHERCNFEMSIPVTRALYLSLSPCSLVLRFFYEFFPSFFELENLSWYLYNVDIIH